MAKLPKELLVSRLKNEIKQCEKLEHEIDVVDKEISTFPLRLNFTLKNTPGPYMADKKISTRFIHKVVMYITEDYPYKKPEVRWQSPIFHPNICTPDDGGFVCSKLLKAWNFQSNLASFVKGLETLLVEPNPKDPYDNPICLMAAKHFTEHPYKPPQILKKEKKSTIKILK